jgi:hypothetical protein
VGVGEEDEDEKLSRARNERKNRIGGMVAGPSEKYCAVKKENPHDGTNCWRGLDSARENVW